MERENYKLLAPSIEIDQIPFDVLVKENEAGIFYLDNDIIIYANDSFAKILNKPPELLIGSSIMDRIDGPDKIILAEGIQKIVEGEIVEYNQSLKVKSEHNLYCSLHLKVHKKIGEVVKIIGSSRDITASVTKFTELTDTISLFDALYNNMVDGIIIYDYAQEKIISGNSSAIKLFGYENEEELKKVNRFQFVPKTSKIFPELDLHKGTKNHGERIMQGEAFKTPGIFVKKDGTHIIVHANVVPTFRNHGEAFIIFQDSTERILAKRAQKATEKRYRDIFQNSHEGIIYTCLKSKKRIICNEKALVIFGVATFEELVKLEPADFFADALIDGISPAEVYKSKIMEASEKGKSELSFRMKKQTGEIIRVTAVLIVDRSDKGQPKIITFLQDFTSLYEARQAINEKNEELEKYINSNLQLENFAYFASHDLQTPLRSMISFTQLLQRSLEGNITSRQQEYMDFIISSSKNMRDLVNDLLSYSLINTTGIILLDINLEESLKELRAEMGSIIKDRNVELSFQNIPALIRADRTKIRQVFQNLISNAIKFSNPETRPKVVVSSEEKEDHWLFSVKDNGIGIDPDYQDKIFLLFKRLHTTGQYEGTGIGLAMVKKIIEQHNGKVWLTSEVGKGSNFYFTIKKKR